MNILSLFDGIGGARLALEKNGVKINNYFSSEIDPFCNQILNHHYDDIIHLGDIKNIRGSDLPHIDLLIGGSPCQDLSIAKKGMGLEGKNSSLFYEFVRILNEVNPKYFLLENVRNNSGKLMSKLVGVDYFEINSKKFSAQSRPRFYWTNIKVDYKELLEQNNSSFIYDCLEKKDISDNFFLEQSKTDKILKNIELNNLHKTSIKKLFTIPKEIHNDNERQRRVYDVTGKSPTILARSDTTKILINNKIRKLTPLECERLQNLPDNYTSICSNTQRYKMIGNGFTVDVIAFILKFMKNPPLKRNVFNLSSMTDEKDVNQIELKL